ncbi:MAG TPA: hypothetical protein VK205_11275 [Prolixibacteraceae bacterium]|nr:hypothetical protein [Prolixibacteraceae bacterium]
MKTLLTLILNILVTAAIAQSETFDLTSYTLPSKQGEWKKEVKENLVSYTKTDNVKRTWCQIGIYRSTASKGSIEADFDSEWQLLIATPYNIQAEPKSGGIQEAEGWEVKVGSGTFSFNNSNAQAILAVMSGNDRVVSIVAINNSQDYMSQIKSLLESVSLAKPDGNSEAEKNTSTVVSEKPNTTVNQSVFAFSSTNFDDGWTSTVQEDWVEVIKSNIKVLIHFPKDGSIFPADPDVLTKGAWDILVAPRYSNLKNFKTSYVEDSKRPYFGTGNATENKTGNSVFVVLFRRGGGWMEVVTPDNNSFTQEFGFNPESIRWGSISEYMGGWVLDNSKGSIVKADAEIFDKLENMVGYNKFAVAASDLNNSGEWKDHFSSNTFYANYYTGAYAGMSTYSSSAWFIFKASYNYHWELAAINSFGGIANAVQSKSDGTFKSLNDWQLYFSDMEGKPKTFDVYFSAIKGGRVLWMNDANYPGSGIFTGFSLSK